MSVRIFIGDCRVVLRTFEAESVHCCVVSVPYWGLRDYKIPPSIWGGDPLCQHEFADETIHTEVGRGNWAQGTNGRGEVQPGGVDAKRQPIRSTAERGFCIHCNAWRGCFGLEPTYQLYVAHTVEIFREVWRVLRKDGTLWINMGDCYACSRAGWTAQRYKDEEADDRTFRDKPFNTFSPKGSFHRANGGVAVTNNGREVDWGYRSRAMQGAPEKARVGSNRAQRGDGNEGVAFGPMEQPNRMPQQGLKQKDLAGIPWRVAFALQDDGWYLRRDIVWHKKNPMPESVYDRPTTAHEYIFLFSKSADTLCWRHRDGRWTWKKPKPDIIWRSKKTRIETREPKKKTNKRWIKINLWRGFDYYYDFAAIMEPSSPDSHRRAARLRSKTHKYADGGPGKQSIAIGSPVAGRIAPVPAGWDEGQGHHGSVHRDGRRQEVGIGHNSRGRKAVPNGAGWKQGGPNSRFKVDRVPRSRKAHASYEGPRPKNNANFDAALGGDLVLMRNKRSVWSIAAHPFKEAHFATFPPKLIEPCILAGCPEGGVVLDICAGAGTTGLVADKHKRNAILIEINPAYAAMGAARIKRENGATADVTIEPATELLQAAE